MFTERFNKIMKIIGAKPTDIAGIIGCDRSAVDRICKGSRLPQNGGKSALRFVAAIYSFADEHGKTADVLNEIGEAIRSWLPLYPSGQIESFYLNGQKNTNISTTLFLCPGYACIYGNNVVGTGTQRCARCVFRVFGKRHRILRLAVHLIKVHSRPNL